MNRIKNCIDWIYSLEHPDGGIRGAEGQPAYPEVSGYLIPILSKVGAKDLAGRLVKYLLRVQEPDGSFKGWQMESSLTFDTAMVLDGLRYANQHTAADAAQEWLLGQLTYGYLQLAEKDSGWRVYNVKAEASLGYQSIISQNFLSLKWPCASDQERIHYIAYGLEGARRFGWNTDVLTKQLNSVDRPFAFWYRSDWTPIGLPCAVGNFQMSLLLNDRDLYENTTRDDLAWTAKYELEAAWHFERE